MTDQVTVPLKSAWASKINWTQAIAGVAMIVAFLTGGQLDVSADQQAALVVVIGVVGNVVTYIQRTWFTRAVTPASVEK
jgi:hypothetical protein